MVFIPAIARDLEAHDALSHDMQNRDWEENQGHFHPYVMKHHQQHRPFFINIRMPSSFPYLEKSRKYGSIPQNLIDSTGTAPVRECSSEWPQLSSRRAKWLLYEINNSKAIPSISYSTGNEVGLSGATPITTTARKALNPTKKFDPVETEVKMEVEGISKSRIGKTPPSPIISNADPDTEAKLTKKFYESQAPCRVRQQLVNQDDAQASL
eukprot:jgi/Bigna1/136782/aug1.35_g11490